MYQIITSLALLAVMTAANRPQKSMLSNVIQIIMITQLSDGQVYFSFFSYVHLWFSSHGPLICWCCSLGSSFEEGKMSKHSIFLVFLKYCKILHGCLTASRKYYFYYGTKFSAKNTRQGF